MVGVLRQEPKNCERQSCAAVREKNRWFSVRDSGFFALFLFIIISFLPGQAFAEITAEVTAENKNGHGRIVFRFFELPEYKIKVVNSVFILSFDDSINMKLDVIMKPLVGQYLDVGRMDPDGKAVRFALSPGVKINSIEAGNRLFLDFLPKNWVGLPPSLPQKVIDELASSVAAEKEEQRRLARRQEFANSKEVLKVRVGEYPTFSRLVFDWKKKIDVKVSRVGNKLNLKFNRMIRTNIVRLKIDPPKFIAGAKSTLTAGGVEFDIMLKDDTNIRAFRQGLTYVVDISGPLNEEDAQERSENTVALPEGLIGTDNAMTSNPREVIELESSEPKPKAMPKMVNMVKPKMSGDDQSGNTVAKQSEQGRTVVAKSPAVEAPMAAKPMAQKPDMKAPVVAKAEQGEDVKKSSPKVAGVDVVKTSVDPVAPQVAKKMAPEKEKSTTKNQPAEQQTKMVKQAVALIKATEPVKAIEPVSVRKTPKMQRSMRIKVEVEEIAENVIILFPFPEETPSAIFQRGDLLWMVFDTPYQFDLSGLETVKEANDRIVDYRTISTTNGVAIQVQLDRPTLTTVEVKKTNWSIALGDLIVTPTKPVAIVPGSGTDGMAKVSLEIKKTGKVNVLEDPAVGDTLAIVTAFGPSQGVIKTQKFVEFSVLASTHGIVVASKIDNLLVSANSDGVSITRAEGLMLSSVEGRDANGGKLTTNDVTRPGQMNFAEWSPGGIENFNNIRSALEREIASIKDPSESVGARMELARLYVANRLGAEALGTMQILKDISPRIENDPVFHALRGVANLMMYRLVDARRDLSTHGLAADKDTQLWLGLLEVEEGHWKEARLNFTNGESVIRGYPEEVKAVFRIKAARANIETNDISTAKYQLAAMPKVNLEIRYTAEAAFLSGRIFELMSRNDDALEAYNEALSYQDRKVGSETQFFKIMLDLRLKNISGKEAVNQLEGLVIAWRGDDVELEAMRELAKLYVVRNNFRRALETMRTAVSFYPDEKLARLIQDDMVSLFAELYLDDKVKKLAPIKALSLYYDFRELTPIGRLGDEMIRKLSDTLVSVDLLDQAAEILSHQVEKRLRGAARAQVATKLAMVHLFRHQPAKALTTIRRTRQAILPKSVSRRRALMEARALVELGRTDQAVILLESLKGKDIELAKATAFWKGEVWQNAGDSYERLLGNVWEAEAELTDEQRLHVLRAAISYTLAEDALGTERLRTKYLAKMKATPDEKTFDVITSSESGQETQFRTLVKKIAAVDTLRGFLEEFRKSGLALDAARAPQS